MAYSDSMFLFEVVVEKLTSFINCKSFVVRGQFADVFSIELRDPSETVVSVPRKKKIKCKSVRVIKPAPKACEKPKIQYGQSILLADNVERLKEAMQNFPIELSLWSCKDAENKLGCAQIFWSQKYINYLNKLERQITPKSVTVSGEYNVFDEVTSKRMAIISLKIKLNNIKNGIELPITSIQDNIIEKIISPAIKRESEVVNTQKQNDIFETGIIKAKYVRDGRKREKKLHSSKNKTKKPVRPNAEINKEPVRIEKNKPNKKQNNLARISTSLVDIRKVEQEKNIDNLALVKSKSFTSTKYENNLNPLNYIFGDPNQPYGNKVYYVGYFTVQNDTSQSQKATPSHGSSTGVSEVQSSEKNQESKRYKIQICDSECPAKKNATDSKTYLSVDLPAEAENLISVKKCDAVECNAKKHKEPPPRADDRILIRLAQPQFTEKIEEVVGGVDAKLKFGGDPCYCSCECRFGFTKRTTYCNVCGGYEKVGDEVAGKDGQLPFPCPIFHKLLDKSKAKTLSTSGSDSKRTMKTGSKTDKTAEPEKPTKKGKQKKKDDRFKFNYGYEGIPPHIGHSHCAMPCSGTLGAVPKNMGWLWTAEDIPGMKFRPMWRPGATNKHVVRLLRMAKNPGEVLTKKRRRDQKPKKALIRPLLIVHKKDGEYTVTMETMKAYNKPRAINQPPYEDKPLLTYTIGRTEEENFDRQKKKEREQRRLERMQRNFIQSAFRDMCHEICLKTYQQALGILPTTESPDCPCFPAHPDASQANLDVSCSCSEQSMISSDTDSDEWIVEFTPPSAKFDPKFKTKKVIKVDNTSQYTYLDYRVKLMDRYGNPVPRFFKGQDGKQLCSDLGGFWGPGRKWLEINVDGYVAPDGRWAPNTFFGPNGELVEAEIGKFQAANGKWYVVGIDGYVDAQNKWRAYPRPRQAPQPKKKAPVKEKGAGGDKKGKLVVATKPSEGTFSCFGDVSPKYLSEMGIMGHGTDKKMLLSALKNLIARGEDVKIPQPKLVPRAPLSKKGKKAQIRTPNVYDGKSLKCVHAAPSSKGILAVNPHGNKIYFRLKDRRNQRPKQRLAELSSQGISLSSFHVPCFHSFINREIMKKQQQERLLAMSASRDAGTQAHAHWGNSQY